MKINVLIADDQPAVRRGLQMSLALEEDFEIVGEAGDGLEAIELVRRLHPHVLVLDVEMPRMDGIEAAQILRAAAPDTKVIFLSLHDSEDLKARAFQAGAFAFIPKHLPLEALSASIRQAFVSTENTE